MAKRKQDTLTASQASAYKLLQEANAALERKIQERTHSLQLALEQADQANLIKGRFLSILSHEILTPITGIIGLSSLLATTNLDDEQREFLQEIETSARDLLEVFNNMLDYSKLGFRSTKLEEVPFNPWETIDSVIKSLWERACQKDMNIHAIIDSEFPELLVGDAKRFAQMIDKFVRNAIKYSDKGVVVIYATFGHNLGTIDGLDIRIAVKDSGMGVSKEHQQEIFDRFANSNAFSQKKQGGTGLGLTLCKQIALLMGGIVGVESAEKEGSTFWFEVPLRGIKRDVPDSRKKAKVFLYNPKETTYGPYLRQQLEHWGIAVEPYTETRELKENQIIVALEERPLLSSSGSPLILIKEGENNQPLSLQEKEIHLGIPVPTTVLWSVLMPYIWDEGAACTIIPQSLLADRITILYIDCDYPLKFDWLTKLIRWGADVDMLRDFSEASLHTLQNKRYDLVLMHAEQHPEKALSLATKLRSLEGARWEGASFTLITSKAFMDEKSSNKVEVSLLAAPLSEGDLQELLMQASERKRRAA